ncbi:glycosyltransferase [Eilatimonas milleporae]|uniref:Glycosyl transferase family 2 n=1 Tax=Eilatimonas milleporae TaxID=911205 RepID=A0A3M0CRT0_9PROT|nr:glycosyltransferase [Eilatimonas milleporae]RMB12281.1 glycosyl transferase family 2 [Eilatimonas milleporae]
MSDHSPRAVCTVIVPAFNESAVIADTLTALTADARPGEFDVIVACNGCTDDTAARAAAAAPDARILDIAAASKTTALNAAIAAARRHPLVFLDADIRTSAGAVRGLVHALIWSGRALACGNARFDTARSSWAVRAFYRAWMQNPYFDDRKMGGFFALSRAGAERIAPLPATTNDDEYIRRRLSGETIVADEAPYRIAAPRTLANLIRVRSRVYRGNRDLERGGGDTAFGAKRRHGNSRRFAARLLARPGLWPGAAIFALTAVAAHLRNLTARGTPVWDRDHSNRQNA